MILCAPGIASVDETRSDAGLFLGPILAQSGLLESMRISFSAAEVGIWFAFFDSLKCRTAFSN